MQQLLLAAIMPLIRAGPLHHFGRILNWMLIAFVLIAAIIGLLYITRGTAVRRVRGIGVDGTPVSPDEASFPLTVSLLTGSTLLPGNQVELVLDGGVFPRLWDDMRGAKTSITVQMYYALSGEVTETLAKILIERAQAGVSVYLLYDAFGAKALGGSYAERLRKAGAQVVAFRPLRFRNLWIIQNRAHIRGIVIDNDIGWTGGFGFDDKWLGESQPGTGWRDTSVRIRGPAVLQLAEACVAAWAEATGDLFTGRVDLPRCDDGVAASGLLYTAPTLGSTPAERFLALSIAGAQRTLFITNAYFAPDKNFVALLVDAASRGVDVQLLVGGPRTDVRVARLAAHGRYDTLLAAGVHIYEYEPTTLHAKTFVADGVWSSVGTMNFDNRSLALNDEVTLMILDSGFGKKMETIFRNDLERAIPVDPAVFKRRPMFEHVKEWGANQITRLL
ncbi:MAG TPA: phospholipase D-like domain-containing protein [Gemmatimonadaceae bacterium]|nr:phospholipase D-like domain-containing protein [Gemmatimonadaceae bacterium]